MSQRREQAAESVETRITQIKTELDAVKADGDTKHTILAPFQHLKSQIALETSGTLISYQQGERAEELFQNALEAIDLKRQKSVFAEDKKVVETRPTKTVKPAQFAAKPYIETAADLDEYLTRLRAEVEKLLSENARIRIQYF